MRPLSSFMRSNIRLMTTTADIPDTDVVLAEEVGDKGILVLNRPKALNPINQAVAHKILVRLRKWQNTKSMILIKGNGGKAFSAGGDVRAVVDATNSYEEGRRIARAEYPMIYTIGNLKIPFVSIMDGITIGGGAGISVPGRYRIATEKTLFAMPETAIGKYHK